MDLVNGEPWLCEKHKEQEFVISAVCPVCANNRISELTRNVLVNYGKRCQLETSIRFLLEKIIAKEDSNRILQEWDDYRRGSDDGMTRNKQ